MIKIWMIFLLLGVLLPAWNTAIGSTISREIADSFYYNVKQVGTFITQEPADLEKTTGTIQFQFPRYAAWLELRPDFQFSFHKFEISAKPRARYQWQKWHGNDLPETTEDSLELFVNEYLLRFQASERLFISWDRENLQWGPGWLFLPSNPFFIENGRSDPMTEIPGKDFARLVYLPDMVWTVSLIANLGKGRWKFPVNESFEQIYAVKIDYSGEESYGGLILSYKEHDNNGVGGFAGWTISDALLLHTDFSVSDIHGENGYQRFSLLFGGSYTFETGPTLTLEYAHQQHDTWFTKLNTIMLQYSHNDIGEMLNITMRATMNFEDHYSRYLAIAELAATDHSLFFINTSVNSGGEEKESGILLDFRVMFGLEYSF